MELSEIVMYVFGAVVVGELIWCGVEASRDSAGDQERISMFFMRSAIIALVVLTFLAGMHYGRGNASETFYYLFFMAIILYFFASWNNKPKIKKQ